MGLLIAIPALIAWSYYSKKVETLTIEMETICDDILRASYRPKDGPARERAAKSAHPAPPAHPAHPA